MEVRKSVDAGVDTSVSGPTKGKRGTRSPNVTDELVGCRLRQARLLRGISQDDLGAAIGVSFQAVQKYETGRNRLSAGRLAAAAKFLEVPLAFLFQDEMMVTAPQGDTIGFTPMEIELVRSYRAITSEDRREHVLRLTKLFSTEAASA
ncbi:MAG TPA: helix-turn-helix domain-containing protein [Stellaceae bacterium]|nr:helix-turn-helix domain-containing protein [Stellaceae bacterium]